MELKEEEILVMKDRFCKMKFISMDGNVGAYINEIDIDKLAKVLSEIEEKLNKK